MFGSTPAKSGESVMKSLSETGLYVPSLLGSYTTNSSRPFGVSFTCMRVALERYQSKSASRKSPPLSISTPTRRPPS